MPGAGKSIASGSRRFVGGVRPGVLVALFASVGVPFFGQAKAIAASETALHGTDWIVRFELPALPTGFEPRMRALLGALVADAGKDVRLDRIALPGTVRIRLPEVTSDATLRRLLEAFAPIRYLEPNRRWTPALQPDDPEFANGNQWGLRNFGKTLWSPADTADGYTASCDSDPGDSFDFCDRDPGLGGVDIDAEAAWTISTGKAGGNPIRVAVVDTGILLDHPDFFSGSASKIWRHGGSLDGTDFADADYGWDACDKDGEPEDLVGHGTQVAAIVAAEGDNDFAGAGVIWDVEILPVKFLAPIRVNDDTDCALTTAAIEALEFVRLVGADVVNMSWGGPEDSPALKDKLAELAAAGMVLVAAAGNDGADLDTSPFFPASYDLPQMFNVAAHTNNGILADFSNYGGPVNVAAPGASIRTYDVPMEDFWAGANFGAYSGPFLEPLSDGALAGTNVQVVGGTWGVGENVLGDKILVADIESALNDQAHAAGLAITLTTESFDAATWGQALLQFTMFHDLGDNSTLRLEYSADGGAWTGIAEAVFRDFGANLYRIDFATALNPLPGDLRVRFRLQTGASHAGADDDLDFVPGGVQLLDLGWLRPDDDYEAGIIFSQGTSLAAPFVAGAAALVRGEFPDWRASDVVQQVLYRAASLSVVNNGVEGSRRLDLAAALSPEPLLVWSGEPGFENDGVEPNAVAPGETVMFAARLLDRDGVVVSTADIYFELGVPDGSTQQLVPTLDASGNYTVSAAFEVEGTYTYKLVVSSETVVVDGPPSQPLEFSVGNPNAASAASGTDDVLPTIDKAGCGCRTGNAPAGAAVWTVVWLGLPLLLNRFWRRASCPGLSG